MQSIIVLGTVVWSAQPISQVAVWGWKTPANLELLVELSRDFPGLSEWEAVLLGSAVPATEDLRDQILREADRLKADGKVSRVPEVDQGTEEDTAAFHWIPACPVPDRLWNVYKGGGIGTMVTSAREAAQHDLVALAPPEGLSEPLFDAYIAGILKQMPLMAEIDRFASTGLTDSQAHRFLAERLGNDDSNPSVQAWRVLKSLACPFLFGNLQTGNEPGSARQGQEAPWLTWTSAYSWQAHHGHGFRARSSIDFVGRDTAISVRFR